MTEPHGDCLLSFITVNYNGLSDTLELIATLPLDDERVEVVVVDNGSRTDEAAVVKEHFPKVKAVRSEENLGFAGGNNLGVRNSTGRYLFFVNNDTFFRQDGSGIIGFGMFQPLIGRLQSDEKIAVVCPKIRFAWGSNPIQYAGYTPLTAVTLRNRAIGFGQYDDGQFNTAHETPYAHGAAMMIKREALKNVGLMPECYFLYYEELDWSMMFRRAGYSIWYEPALSIFHKESQSTGQSSPLRTYYITRNRLLFVSRNTVSRAERLCSYAYMMFVVAARDILKYAFARRFDLVKATMNGIKDFIKKK